MEGSNPAPPRDTHTCTCPFRFNHHKSCWSWGQPIRGKFPTELVEQLIRPYLVAARPVLANPGVQTFFVNPKGYPFSAEGLAIYYANM